jgi:hypothetical protein
MSVIKDKNLLFYSVHPSDKYSQEFLTELNKVPLLKNQFILVCVNDPNIKIPEKIRKMNIVPVLVVPGLNNPILGPDAISWLKNCNFQEKANGLDYGTLDDPTFNCAYLDDEMKTSNHNQYFNSEYNHGFTDRDSILNQRFSNIKSDTHIETYENTGEMKKNMTDQLNNRLEQLKAQRENDVPKPVKKIGGLENMTMNQNSHMFNPSQVPHTHQNASLPYTLSQNISTSAHTRGQSQLPFDIPQIRTTQIQVPHNPSSFNMPYNNSTSIINEKNVNSQPGKLPFPLPYQNNRYS